MKFVAKMAAALLVALAPALCCAADDVGDAFERLLGVQPAQREGLPVAGESAPAQQTSPAHEQASADENSLISVDALFSDSSGREAVLDDVGVKADVSRWGAAPSDQKPPTETHAIPAMTVADAEVAAPSEHKGWSVGPINAVPEPSALLLALAALAYFLLFGRRQTV